VSKVFLDTEFLVGHPHGAEGHVLVVVAVEVEDRLADGDRPGDDRGLDIGDRCDQVTGALNGIRVEVVVQLEPCLAMFGTPGP
jgi:hypothetical protein